MFPTNVMRGGADKIRFLSPIGDWIFELCRVILYPERAVETRNMHTVFTRSIGIPGEAVTLDVQEQKHLFTVLRVGVGERIRLLNGLGDVGVALVSAGKRIVVTERHHTDSKPPFWILCCAAPRRQKLDTLLKQASELGVREVHLVHCSRSVATPQKSERWEVLLREGCKQSGNPFLPSITVHPSLQQLLTENEHVSLFYGSTVQTNRKQIRVEGEKIAFLVGPEGGFTSAELHLLEQHRAIGISLGPWILRLETAAVCGIAALRTLSEANL